MKILFNLVSGKPYKRSIQKEKQILIYCRCPVNADIFQKLAYIFLQIVGNDLIEMSIPSYIVKELKPVRLFEKVLVMTT